MYRLLLVFITLVASLQIGMADPIIIEAESFVPDKNAVGWKAGQWGENYYAATFANTFLSRKAFLGASEQAKGAVASTEVNVPATGEYLALVRYEAAPGFQTQFTLRIEQNGKTWERVYGARENVKIWAFKEGLKPEVSWPWGAVENIVWEGHDTRIPLQSGRAKMSLIANKQVSPAAKRNVDLVMLTTDKEQVDNRIAKEGYLPLDGMLTQRGDLSARIHNKSPSPLTITIPPGREHSPYWVHLRNWKPLTIEVAPNASSGWTEVGSLLDTLNDGQWEWKTKGENIRYDVEFDFPTNARKSTLRFSDLKGDVSFAYDADTKSTRRVRLSESLLYELLAELKQQTVIGKPPSRTIIYGHTFPPRPDNPQFTRAREEFIQLLGVNGFFTDTGGGAGEIPEDDGLVRGYIDIRGRINKPEELEKYLKQLEADGKAARVATVSVGDEIGLPRPPNDDQSGFRAWLQARKLNPQDVAATADSWEKVSWAVNEETRNHKPSLFYYSSLYAHDFGIQKQKAITDLVLKYLPQAGVGANFSPHHGAPYLGEVYKWSRLFREGGMTMPWSEDYAWQIPIGSQQMSFFNIDLMRGAISNRPDGKIHYYVMAHDPGNTPSMWRRLWYGALAHGVKVFNLYEVRPVEASYTENYVNSPAMYREIRRAVHELGTFEDFVQDGKVLPAQVALWHGETGDIWNNNRAPFGAAKRALYVAIRHQQLPLDIVTEGDDLASYKLLYLADRNVSRASSQIIADWVKNGGTLFATAGAGMRDEFDKPNTILAEMFGVNETSLQEANEPIRWIKQDLPTATKIGDVRWSGNTLPALGAVSRIQSNAQVLAAFTDGSPAMITRTVEKGSATYSAFLPSLSYFKPAIPHRPVDRGSTEDAMAQFIPTNFNMNAQRLIATAAAGIARPVVSSDPLVETTVIQSPHGVLIPLTNWRGQPIKNLRVEISGFEKYSKARLGSGAKVRFSREKNKSIATLDLDVADALILQ